MKKDIFKLCKELLKLGGLILAVAFLILEIIQGAENNDQNHKIKDL